MLGLEGAVIWTLIRKSILIFTVTLSGYCYILSLSLSFTSKKTNRCSYSHFQMRKLTKKNSQGHIAGTKSKLHTMVCKSSSLLIIMMVLVKVPEGCDLIEGFSLSCRSIYAGLGSGRFAKGSGT